MIIILDYKNSNKQRLNLLFERSGIEFKHSLHEKDIIAADKIILPDPVNIDNAFRKLYLMNLTSVLRLVRCPILGINSALFMMCKGDNRTSKFGMCFFDSEISPIGNYVSQNRSTEGTLNIMQNSKLLESNYHDLEISFDREKQPVKNVFSTVAIKKENEEYSLLFENRNYYGLVLNSDENEDLFNHIIRNFTELV